VPEETGATRPLPIKGEEETGARPTRPPRPIPEETGEEALIPNPIQAEAEIGAGETPVAPTKIKAAAGNDVEELRTKG